MTDELHVLDTGSEIAVTIEEDGAAVDVSGATQTKDLVFRRPDGSRAVRAASFETDGTDGVLLITTGATLLTLPGRYDVQAHIILAAGEWRSSYGQLRINPNL